MSFYGSGLIPWQKIISMSILLKLVQSVRNLQVSKALLSLQFEGYLKESGWINSFASQMPLDHALRPLPWVTLPFIDFIEPRLKKDFILFEYGSGNSTRYYSSFVSQVFAVEHDQEWFHKMSESLPDNAKLIFQDLQPGGLYCKMARNIDESCDIIIVDGRDRVNCLINSLNALSTHGVIVLDDSERHEYIEGHDFLRAHNFKKIDFWGMAPGIKYKKCTTIFYKAQNCLSI